MECRISECLSQLVVCLFRLSSNLPLQPRRSLRNLENADISGLSCILLPFLPRKPHRLAKLSSSVGSSTDARLPDCLRTISVRRLLEELGPRCKGEPGPVPRCVEPPRIAATEECAHLACLRMAEVTVMHSVVTSATGSMAIATLGFVKVKLREATTGSSSRNKDMMLRERTG
jgi:hypothetical protein